ncbi:glycosyltransferase [Pyrococcus sp. ST04]|uniref:glycosyltransferase family 2 protein n=1 Tax=Pyrococcus sp. ST04 TaxID=1183377 RepID=UPI001ED8FCCD|nr:glycosyltransferase [Pyrococcus sp. ST04]
MVYLYLLVIIVVLEIVPLPWILEGTLLFLFFMVFSGTIFYSLLILATRRDYPFNAHELKRERPSIFDPLVYVLIPAHNEERVIGRTVKSVLNQDYLNMKIFLINDNSTDNTLEVMMKYAELDKRIVVINVPPGRGRKKPKALNYALEIISIAFPEPEFIFILDADYILPPDAIRTLARILENAPNYVIGIQGNVRPRNWNRNFITRFITLERLVGFNVAIEGDMKLNENGKYGGTVALLRYRHLASLGFFNEDVVTEDTELWARALLSGYRFWYYHGVIGWEEAVEDMKSYIRQRSRWAQGHLQVMLDYYWSVVRGATSIKEMFIEHFYLMSYLVPVFWFLSVVLNSYLLISGIPRVGILPPKVSIINALIAFLVFWFSIAYANYVESQRIGFHVEWYYVALYPMYFIIFVGASVIYTLRALFRLLVGKLHWEKTRRFT